MAPQNWMSSKAIIYILHMQRKGPCFVFHQRWDHLPVFLPDGLVYAISVSRLVGK